MATTDVSIKAAPQARVKIAGLEVVVPITEADDSWLALFNDDERRRAALHDMQAYAMSTEVFLDGVQPETASHALETLLVYITKTNEARQTLERACDELATEVHAWSVNRGLSG
jgi:hypothetical protein